MKTTAYKHYPKQKIWVHSNTFGGKERDFWWKIEDDFISIIRYFFTQYGPKQKRNSISPEDLDKLNKYVSNKKERLLADDVAKLYSRTEKKGLGEYCYRFLGWNNTKSQLVGQLGVIFSNSGVWQYNGRKRNMKFKKLSEDWRNLINNYYKNCKKFSEDQIYKTIEKII
jgi:hypothetical protein